MIIGQNPFSGATATTEEVLKRIADERQKRQIFDEKMAILERQVKRLMKEHPSPNHEPGKSNPDYNRRYFIAALKSGRVFHYPSGLTPPSGMGRADYFQSWGRYMAIPADELMAIVELLDLCNPGG